MPPVYLNKKIWRAIGIILPTITALIVGALKLSRVEPVPTPREPAKLFFTQNYPTHEHFQQELQLLRSQGKLKKKNELQIQKSIQETSAALKMPPAILWCLLFQESRLNHLEGWKTDRSSRGIGQFSYFSVYEINHNLNHFNPDNERVFQQTLGRDIRPLVLDEFNLQNKSSYFYIPTAVATSGTYLSNRYHQLRQILERKHFAYNPDLLWLYAAMAYNKGTRSVLSFWSYSLRTKHELGLQKMLNEDSSFRESVSNHRIVHRILRRIWPANQAGLYANELRIHMKNMWECAVAVKEEKGAQF